MGGLAEYFRDYDKMIEGETYPKQFPAVYNRHSTLYYMIVMLNLNPLLVSGILYKDYFPGGRGKSIYPFTNLLRLYKEKEFVIVDTEFIPGDKVRLNYE